MNRRHFLAASILGAGGCTQRDRRLVLYCAQDREFAEGLLAEFTHATGLGIASKFDTEANKSVSLAAELEKEANRPRCDVHWNNEILGTIRLARKSIYLPYAPANSTPFPAWTKAPNHTWHAFAARARVLIVNTKRVKESDRPKSLNDLIAPRWRGAVAMAKPFFGTTATHAACLFAGLGTERAKALFQGLKDNEVALVAGNKQVAVNVANGKFSIGMTDSDDALIEIKAGKPVAMIQTDDQFGTLFIPNTLAIINNGPNPDGAKKLLEYLLRPETEKQLAEGGGFQIPLNPSVSAVLPTGLLTPENAKPMNVDFDRASDCWDDTQRFLRDTFGA